MGGRGGGGRSSAETIPPTAAPATDMSLSPGESTVANRAIRKTWEKRANGDPTAWVSMENLRKGMAEAGITDKQEQTAEILKFVRARNGVAIPQSNQRILTQAQRDAAVTLGGEQKTLFKVLR